MYSEIYAGLAGKTLSSYIYFSPDFSAGVRTLYGQVDATFPVTGRLRVTGHVGALMLLGSPIDAARNPARYDIELGVVRRFGSFDLRVSWSAAGPNRKDSCNSTCVGGQLASALTYTF